MNKLLNYLDDESGATAIEYGLIAALIAVAIIAGATSIRTEIMAMFAGTDSKFSKAFD